MVAADSVVVGARVVVGPVVPGGDSVVVGTAAEVQEARIKVAKSPNVRFIEQSYANRLPPAVHAASFSLSTRPVGR